MPPSPTLDRPSACPRPALPPVGPAWFPSVMGTGILTLLVSTYGGGAPDRDEPARAVAVALLVVACLLVVGLAGGFAARVARRPSVLRESVRTVADLAGWGTVAMGVMAVGSAALAVAPVAAPAAVGAWLGGTVLGLATSAGFTAVLARGEAGEPSLVWGLPVVPPMVSATGGAALVAHLWAGDAVTHPLLFVVLVVSVGCFFVALALGTFVFALGYHHHWHVAPVPVAASTSTWIPLGIVGQSVAAAQALASAAGHWTTPATARDLRTIAVAYGVVALAAGVPLAAWAALVTFRGFRRRMPFGPGWWALTFPVGTVSLGLHHLAGASGAAWVADVGLAVLLVLGGTWVLCAVTTARAVLGLLAEWRGVGALRRGRYTRRRRHPLTTVL